TAAGARPVSKMNGRAASIRCERTCAGPSTTPPWLPSALDNVVVITTSGAPANPSSCSRPRPPPRTPRPCASSTTSRARYLRQTSSSARTGASEPSAENTESVTTTARSSSREPSAAATASTSTCGATTTRARDSRQASTSDACEYASETSSEPGPDKPTTAPRLAVYPEENSNPEAAPTNSATSDSNCWCNSVSPVTRREPVEPAPHMRSACTPPSMTP